MEREGIREFYQNKSLLITGATGFMGMALMEKLLRSFPELAKIYVVIRPNKHGSIEERIQHYFDNKIFSTIKVTSTNYAAKIIWIKGDILVPNLGIHEKQLQDIKSDVNIIVHNAASTNFGMPFKPSVITNIGGTLNVLKLASICPQLKAFMYVSTLYVNHRSTQNFIEERLYHHPIEPMVFLKMVKESTEKEIMLFSKEVIAEWYNFYLYTKNAAENLVYTYANSFPIGIYRPGMVMFSKAEPIPYWAVTNAGLPRAVEEFRRGYNLKTDMNTNIAPVDMAVNGLIAAIYDTAKNKRQPKFYNYASGTTNQLTGTSMMTYFTQPRKQLIPYESQDYIEACKKKDGALLSKGLKPFYLDEYKNLNKLRRAFMPFMLKKYYCQTDNINQLWSEMSEEEKKLLFFDLSVMDWNEYMTGLVKSLPPIQSSDDILKEPSKL